MTTEADIQSMAHLTSFISAPDMAKALAKSKWDQEAEVERLVEIAKNQNNKVGLAAIQMLTERVRATMVVSGMLRTAESMTAIGADGQSQVTVKESHYMADGGPGRTSMMLEAALQGRSLPAPVVVATETGKEENDGSRTTVGRVGQSPTGNAGHGSGQAEPGDQGRQVHDGQSEPGGGGETGGRPAQADGTVSSQEEDQEDNPDQLQDGQEDHQVCGRGDREAGAATDPAGDAGVQGTEGSNDSVGPKRSTGLDEGLGRDKSTGGIKHGRRKPSRLPLGGGHLIRGG